MPERRRWSGCQWCKSPQTHLFYKCIVRVIPPAAWVCEPTLSICQILLWWVQRSSPNQLWQMGGCVFCRGKKTPQNSHLMQLIYATKPHQCCMESSVSAFRTSSSITPIKSDMYYTSTTSEPAGKPPDLCTPSALDVWAQVLAAVLFHFCWTWAWFKMIT